MSRELIGAAQPCRSVTDELAADLDVPLAPDVEEPADVRSNGAGWTVGVLALVVGAAIGASLPLPGGLQGLTAGTTTPASALTWVEDARDSAVGADTPADSMRGATVRVDLIVINNGGQPIRVVTAVVPEGGPVLQVLEPTTAEPGVVTRVPVRALATCSTQPSSDDLVLGVERPDGRRSEVLASRARTGLLVAELGCLRP